MSTQLDEGMGAGLLGIEPSGTPDNQSTDPKQASTEPLVPEANSLLPEGHREEAKGELIPVDRYKNLQSIFSKKANELKSAQDELAALKAENEALKQNMQFKLNLSEEEALELEMLKSNDPDAWRLRLNELEQQQAAELSKAARQHQERMKRQQILADWNANNPDAIINDVVVETKLPYKLVNSLKEGKITFEAFIEQAGQFLKSSTVGGPGAASTPMAGVQAPIVQVGGAATGTAQVSKEDPNEYLFI